MKKAVCFLLLILLFTSCSPQENEDIKPSISVSIIDRNLIPAHEGTYANNRWTAYINEHSPVNVSWVPISEDNFEQALSIMFNANTAPDLIVNDSRALMQTLADKKLIQPLDAFIDSYSTSYAQYLKEHEYLKLYTTLNKQTYLFTSEGETTADSAIWMRKDWLDTLGIAPPKTTGELLAVAQAFTYSDPDKNNLNDTIGIVSTNDMLEQIYMVDQQWYADDSGYIYLSQLTDRYISMLLYKRQLFSDGIIDKSFILDNSSQNRIQPWLDGKSGILFSSWNADEFRQLFKNHPSVDVCVLGPLTTEHGNFSLRHKSPTGHYIAFNHNMKNPKAGVEFLDYMIDSGYHTLLYGIEGEHYKNKDGNIHPIDNEKNSIELDYATYDMPLLRKSSTSPEQIMASASADDVFDLQIASLSANSLSIALKYPRKQNIPVDISANVTKIKQFETEWNVYIKDIESEFILSTFTATPISAEMLRAKLQNEWNRLGGDNIRTLMQQWYDENRYSFIHTK